jgi:SAM-dependent methyltransferase
VSLHDTPRAESAPLPHPLARTLALALANESQARLLLVGVGNGRNLPPFADAGIRVDAVEADPERARAASLRFAGTVGIRVACAAYAGPFPFSGGFAGALSTNALLHGAPADVGRTLAAIRACLRPGALCYATFGSTRDPRFGRGRRIDDATFAPESGSEANVPHAYFDERRLRDVLNGFTIDEAHEASAAGTAGAWAHAHGEAADIVHWFVKARLC